MDFINLMGWGTADPALKKLMFFLFILAAGTWLMMWVLANAMVKDMTRKLDHIIEIIGRLHPR